MVVSTYMRAQSIGPATLNATGGTTIIGGNEFDWSVGEMTMVSTFTASNLIVTQGLLQPSVDLTAVPGTHFPVSQLQVFPNPASSVVNFQYQSQSTGTLDCRLIDMTGKVINSQNINIRQGANEGQVDLTNLACATYFLEISVHSGSAVAENISYKIQKIK